MARNHSASTNPKRTLWLLDELQQLGFDNQAFGYVHQRGPGHRIKEHRKYCEGRVQSFGPTSENARTQERLELVLKAYWCGGLSSGKQEAFVALAKAACTEIPINASRPDRAKRNPGLSSPKRKRSS
jgi:hypothetical protein